MENTDHDITFRAHEIVVGDQTAYYVDSQAANKKTPTIIMLHGFMSDSQSLMPLASLLQHEGRIIIPDLPGFGRSAPFAASDTPSIKMYAQWLDGFLAAVVKAKEPVIILGYSFGAYIVQVYLGGGDVDARVRGSVLLCPVTRIHWRANFYTSVFLRLSELSEEMAERAWRSQHDFTTVYLSKMNHPRKKLDLIRYRRREMSFFNPLLVRDLFVDIRNLDTEEYFSHIDVPVRALLADKDNLADNNNTYRLMETYASENDIYEVDGVGHLAPLEAPERIKDTVREALKNL